MSNIPRGARAVRVVDGALRIDLGSEELTYPWNGKDEPRYADVDHHASCAGSHVEIQWTIRILDGEGALLDTIEYETYA